MSRTKKSDRPLYEAMFVLPQSAAANLASAKAHIEEIFSRADAEVLVLRRWDERRLAYPIDGQKRGTFILAFFRAKGTRIVNIERDCNLSEMIMRAMIMRADHMGDVELELEKQEPSLGVEAQLRDEQGSDSPAADEAGSDAGEQDVTEAGDEAVEATDGEETRA